MPYTAEQVRSRHPFELLFLFVTLLTAVGGMLAKQVRPGSLQEGMGPTGTMLWYLFLLLSSLAALVGIIWPERATGLLLEAVGLLIAGLCTVLYAVGALILLRAHAGFAAGMLFGYGAAAIWRARDIRKFLVTVAKEHARGYEE